MVACQFWHTTAIAGRCDPPNVRDGFQKPLGCQSVSTTGRVLQTYSQKPEEFSERPGRADPIRCWNLPPREILNRSNSRSLKNVMSRWKAPLVTQQSWMESPSAP